MIPLLRKPIVDSWSTTTALDWRQPVLIRLRYRIGDAMMELPVLQAVRDHWSSDHLTASMRVRPLSFCKGIPITRPRPVCRISASPTGGDRGTSMGRCNFQAWVVAQQFDCVLDAAHAVAGIRQVLDHADIAVLNTGADLTAAGSGAGFGMRLIGDSAVRAWKLWRGSQPRPVRPLIPESAQRWAKGFLRQRKLVKFFKFIFCA